MRILDDIAGASRKARPRIVLAEGDDPRIREAAVWASADGLAEVILLGSVPLDGVETINTESSMRSEAYAEAFFELRKHKGVTEETARKAIQNPLGFAAMMVREGHADGTVAGAVNTTSDVVRTALQIIGRAPGVQTVSSYFLMILGAPHNRPVVFADCGLVLQPNAEELAAIAVASAKSLTSLTGLEPKVAMLSFSTMGSVPQGAHESLGRIAEAIELAKAAEPELAISGELQFDAAIVPEVAAAKAPGADVQGDANVFVFPSLSAGNIGYKIAQRIGGAVALGPVLQGLERPANDLSRGCTADDVYKMIAITGAQAAMV